MLEMAGNEELAPEKRVDGQLCRNCEVGKPCRLCFSDRARGTVKSERLANFTKKLEKNIGLWVFGLDLGKDS